MTQAHEVVHTMAAAAISWLDLLGADQRQVGHWGAPAAPETAAETERRRWFYTPTDHGGLAYGRQRPAQQQAAMRLVASGVSEAAYVTVCTILGLDNVLDRTEGWTADWGRERGRDPGSYFLRVFGTPGGSEPWGWRFGGHHVSLNTLVLDGAVAATTPCFLGADPATAPLLGGAVARPLAGVEDLARTLVRSLSPALAGRAILLDRAPADIIGGNRSRVAEGDQMMLLGALWRQRFTLPRLADRIEAIEQAGEAGVGAQDHRRLALTTAPQGVAGVALDAGQRGLLADLVGCYRGRAPESLQAALTDAELDAVHLLWAGPTEPGAPLYYRLQGPRLLCEYDNTQRQANHAHSVWRDPTSDFGLDALAAHHEAHRH